MTMPHVQQLRLDTASKIVEYVPLECKSMDHDKFLGEDREDLERMIDLNAPIGATHWDVLTTPTGRMLVDSDPYKPEKKAVHIQYWAAR